jgi:hypothetical protein
MKRLRILVWHIHGSYLNALARIEHDWFLPTKPGKPEGYGGRGATFDWPEWVREVPAERVAELELDLVVYQTPKNLFFDGPELLGDRQAHLPAIYLEHNTPRPDAVETLHPAARLGIPIVHVTNYNRLMWDNGTAPTSTIEHSVAINSRACYDGSIAEGIVVVNSMARRARIAGFDVLIDARREVPLTVAGMESEIMGGLGDIPYRDLHRVMAQYRFLFSPIRYTSLPLAVIEAMTIGMPVVALATTELPSVIEDGVTGFVSCDPAYLTKRMKELIADPLLARNLGEGARETARRRFGLARFVEDWNRAFESAIAGCKQIDSAVLLGTKAGSR